MRRITSRDKPAAIARATATHQAHLLEALAIASRRAVRSTALVQQLLRRATVQGLAERLNAKVASVSFRVPKYKQVWYQLYSWSSLARETPAQTAKMLAWSLRESIRQAERTAAKRNGNA